jgi:nicotinamide riboside kinase
MKTNIAIAGGPCTGKSVLAAHLFAHLKILGFDYDLVLEECRKLKKEFGNFEGPFERFYMWRQQEREELRSNAKNGFITDKPLFHYWAQARQFASKPKDQLAVRELYRMCLELENRYQLIIIPQDPDEVNYKTDESRSSEKEIARERHIIICNFVNHLWPKKILYVHGNLEERTEHAIKVIKKIHQEK